MVKNLLALRENTSSILPYILFLFSPEIAIWTWLFIVNDFSLFNLDMYSPAFQIVKLTHWKQVQ